MDKFAETLGNLWFSTIITFKPLGILNFTGTPNFTTGSGPAFGIVLLSICALVLIVATKRTRIAKIFVFIIGVIF